MSIQKRGKSWRARYRDPSGRSRSRSFARKLDAQRWLATVEVGRQRGDWVDPAHGRLSYGDWSRDWIATQSHLKPSTRTRYGVALRRHILPSWDKVPLHSIRVRLRWSDYAAVGMAPLA